MSSDTSWQSPHPYRCWTEINLSAMERNIGAVRHSLPDDMKYIAVVKADAYGHGIIQTASRLMQTGADAFAVANIHEAQEIQQIGSGWPILILSAILPHEDPLLADIDCIPTLSCLEEVTRWQSIAEQAGKTMQVHLKIDTGMGRLGVWYQEAPQLYQAVRQAPNLQITGIYTHFSDAAHDQSFTQTQRQRLHQFIEQLDPDEVAQLWIHADNSASISQLPHLQEYAPFNAVRIGLLQFGAPSSPFSFLPSVATTPVLSFHSRVSLTKTLPQGTPISYGRQHHLAQDSTIAIISAGYGDGIPTSLSNCGFALIHGQRCPILGRVTMDQTIVDISPLQDVHNGDLVTLIGRQGQEEITVQEFSELSGDIAWETFCSITKRVQRLYTTNRS